MKSIEDLLRESGIPCQRSEKDVQASIDIMKRFMHGDGENPWMYVSSNCERFIDSAQNWEHGDHEPDILAAGRYGAVWAVLKRLTRLADIIPTLRVRPDPISNAEADLLLAVKLQVRRTGRVSRWAWDSQAGAPF